MKSKFKYSPVEHSLGVNSLKKVPFLAEILSSEEPEIKGNLGIVIKWAKFCVT